MSALWFLIPAALVVGYAIGWVRGVLYVAPVSISDMRGL